MKDQHFVYRVLQAVNVNPAADAYFNIEEDYPGYYRVEIDSDDYVICTEDGALCAFENMIMDEMLSYFNSAWINAYMPAFDLEDTELLMKSHPHPKVVKRLIGDNWDKFLHDSLFVDGIENGLCLNELIGEYKVDGVDYWVLRA